MLFCVGIVCGDVYVDAVLFNVVCITHFFHLHTNHLHTDTPITYTPIHHHQAARELKTVTSKDEGVGWAAAQQGTLTSAQPLQPGIQPSTS